ncbi:dipeptidase [Gottschalkiaceae bacterium SANA]|nr:dipeptidase [Gottschalkiaceae bacterium SANA]
MRLVDFHCDTILRLMNGSVTGDLMKNDGHIDLERLQQIGALAQFFAVFVDWEDEAVQVDPFAYALRGIQLFKDQVKLYKDQIGIAHNLEGILKLEKENRLAGILTIEEGAILEGKMDRLETLYQEGVRLITLTWNYENSLGYPNAKDPILMGKGLKSFGKEVVERMNDLGMIVDVSHLSDGGFWDVVEISKKPFIASHSNARAIKDVTRNLTDPMIRAIANQGGVIGLNFCPFFLNEENHETVDALVQHLIHIIDQGGVEVAAIGTDFDGIGGKMDLAHVGQMDRLRHGLRKAGVSSSSIDKIFCENGLRVILDTMR